MFLIRFLICGQSHCNWFVIVRPAKDAVSLYVCLHVWKNQLKLEFNCGSAAVLFLFEKGKLPSWQLLSFVASYKKASGEYFYFPLALPSLLCCVLEFCKGLLARLLWGRYETDAL